jgi:RND family efflux transporter MFP subunit
MKKIIVVAVAILLIAGAVLVVMKKKGSIATTPAMASYPLPVEVAQAEEGSVTTSSHYLGMVVPVNYTDISPRITGNILSVTVREGDRVSKGQLLVAIDERALKERESAQALEVAGAEAQLAGARSVYETQQAIYERDQMLYKEQAISLEALQKSTAQKDAAYAQARSLEEKIKALKNSHNAAAFETSYARLYSPIDGIITKRLQEPGDLAMPGKPVLRVECTTDFKVVVQVPQADMVNMKTGVRVLFVNGGSKIGSSIIRVYPAITVNTLGTIEIPKPKELATIPSGGTVGVEVITGKTGPGMLVPLNALLETERGAFIFKAETAQGENSQKVRVLPVQVLGKNGEYACVKGDIKKGDLVITGDEGKLLRLSEGMAVVASKPTRS